MNAKPWIVGVLVVAAVIRALADFAPAQRVDFYQFWAVPTAQQISASSLGTPYANPAAYRAVLDRRFAGVTDPGLARLHRYRMQHFEPMGTPLLYLLFAPLPNDYGLAAWIFGLLQLGAVAAGTVLLARRLGLRSSDGLALAALCVLGFGPLGDDLFTGNLNAFQLAALAVTFPLAARARPARGAPLRAAPAAGYLLLAVGLSLVKPNLLLVSAALVAHLALRSRGVALLRPALLAAAALAGLGILPCAFFGSAHAWAEWARFVFVEDPGRLAAIPLAGGNTATPRLLADLSGLSPALAAALVGVGLAATLLAGTLAVRGRPRGLSSFPSRLTLVLGWSLADPVRAASFALVVTFALSPLLWFHYFVLALVPGLWLAAKSPRWSSPWCLAVGALGIYSGAYAPLLARVTGGGLAGPLAGLFAVTWLLLWSALLLQAHRELPGAARAAEAAPVAAISARTS